MLSLEAHHAEQYPDCILHCLHAGVRDLFRDQKESRRLYVENMKVGFDDVPRCSPVYSPMVMFAVVGLRQVMHSIQLLLRGETS